MPPCGFPWNLEDCLVLARSIRWLIVPTPSSRTLCASSQAEDCPIKSLLHCSNSEFRTRVKPSRASTQGRPVALIWPGPPFPSIHNRVYFSEALFAGHSVRGQEMRRCVTHKSRAFLPLTCRPTFEHTFLDSPLFCNFGLGERDPPDLRAPR